MSAPEPDLSDEPPTHDLHALLAFSCEGLALLDAQGRICWANSRLAELSGRPRARLIGLAPNKALAAQTGFQLPAETGLAEMELPIRWQPVQGALRRGNIRLQRLAPGTTWLFALQDLGIGPALIEAHDTALSPSTANERAALATQGPAWAPGKWIWSKAPWSGTNRCSCFAACRRRSSRCPTMRRSTWSTLTTVPASSRPSMQCRSGARAPAMSSAFASPMAATVGWPRARFRCVTRPAAWSNASASIGTSAMPSSLRWRARNAHWPSTRARPGRNFWRA